MKRNTHQKEDMWIEAGFWCLVGTVIIGVVLVAMLGCAGLPKPNTPSYEPPPMPAAVDAGSATSNYTLSLLALGIGATAVVLLVMGARGRGFTLLVSAVGVAIVPYLSSEIIDMIRWPLTIGMWLALAAAAFWLAQRSWENFQTWRRSKRCSEFSIETSAELIIANNPAKYRSAEAQEKLYDKLSKKNKKRHDSAKNT